jgi:hypothetical protein
MMLQRLAAPLALATFVFAAGEPGMMGLSSSEFVFVSVSVPAQCILYFANAQKRPDLRPPRFNVTTYRPEQLSPGYWFVAPYVDLGAQSGSPNLCQIGPHIYDDQGVRLVGYAVILLEANTV